MCRRACRVGEERAAVGIRDRRLDDRHVAQLVQRCVRADCARARRLGLEGDHRPRTTDEPPADDAEETRGGADVEEDVAGSEQLHQGALDGSLHLPRQPRHGAPVAPQENARRGAGADGEHVAVERSGGEGDERLDRTAAAGERTGAGDEALRSRAEQHVDETRERRRPPGFHACVEGVARRRTAARSRSNSASYASSVASGSNCAEIAARGRAYSSGASRTRSSARARAPASPGGTTSPIPVRSTGWRTLGRSLATTGVPQSIASTWTSPKDSVELTLGTTSASSAPKNAGISRSASSAGSRRRRYSSSPGTFSYGPANRNAASGKRSRSAGAASSRVSTPFSAASLAARPITGPRPPSGASR